MDKIQVDIIRTKFIECLIEDGFNVAWGVEGVPEFGSEEDFGTWDGGFGDGLTDFFLVLVGPCTVDVPVSSGECSLGEGRGGADQFFFRSRS